MKKILLVLFAAVAGCLCSCSGNQYLSREKVQTEQVRVVQYFSNRADGFAFRGGFYDATDSNLATVPDGDKRTFEVIRDRICSKRKDDSTGRIRSLQFRILASEFDNDFEIAKGGRK